MIVAEAAGSPEVASGALSRFGFSTIVASSRLDQGLARLRAEAFDLLIIPLDDIDQAHLAMLEREIHARPGLSVIGTAVTANPELILRAMRSGVHEFLVHPPTGEDLAGAAERLARRGGIARTGRVIAVHSGKGGLGTTSIAVNLADALSATASPGTVSLVDCVFSGGDVRVFLNLPAAYDMGDVVRRLDEMDGGMLHSLATQGPHGTCVIPAAEDPMFDDTFDGPVTSAVVQQLRSAFETSIVDTEHQLNERTLAVLDAADVILLVTQPNVPAIRSTQRTLELFQRVGYGGDKAKLVLNRFQYGDIFTLKNVAESLKREIYWSFPNDYRTTSSALNKGVPVSTEDPSSKLAQSVAQLAVKLRGVAHGATASSAGGSDRSRLRKLFSSKRGTNNGT